MKPTRHCFLRCSFDTHTPLKLPHNVEVFVGRSRDTKIKDQSCSRRQLSLKADCEECYVELKQIGINPSGVDGFALKKDTVYKLGHKSRIEVLLNNYTHVIEFVPPPEHYTSPEKITSSPKRKLSDDDNQRIHKNIRCGIESSVLSSPVIPTEDVWEDIDEGKLYVFTTKNSRSSNKIAAFDMDGTLIKTKSGKVYPVDLNDWQLAFHNVSQKLKAQLDEGFKIVIFSNQAPIGNGRVKIEDFKKKIEAVVNRLGVPIQVYIATGKSFYRKPAKGMWKTLQEQKNDSIKIDMDQSFYCGDAAGRVANWAPGKKKDHSMADILMAQNLNLKFYTPEQFFLGLSISNKVISKPQFVPMELKVEPFNDSLISHQKEILVLVGYPGSGKSFLAKQIEERSNHRYATVCRDVLGSWQKCAAEAKKLLQQGKSVIVDSTNPDVESRGRWTNLAQEMKVECRCAKMATTKAHAQHNNKFRELMRIKHVPVNDIVFNTYKNKFSAPSQNEGFKEVIDVKFNPIFEDEESEKCYRMHLLEKF